MALTPKEAEANNSYFNDIASAYTAGGWEYTDKCDICHGKYGGGKSRGDAAVFHKLFDWAGDTNVQPAFLDSDPFRVGVTNRQKRDAADALTPYAVGWPSLGFTDKDKDGYVRLFYRTITTGQAMEIDAGTMTNSWPTITPDGWDVDDNDASQGNAAWNNDTPGTTTDSQAPPAVTDLRANTLPSNALDFIWTAPGDDPAGGSDETVPVHHYDMRYTTEAIVGALNHSVWTTTYCGGTAHDTACDIRNPSHWDDMWNIADCSLLATGGATANVLFKDLNWSGNADGVGSNETCSDDVEWNHGVGSPLMRALLEPVPSTPGNNETFNMSEITAGIVTPGLANINQIVDGTTYWVAVTSTDGRMIPTGGAGFSNTPTGFTEPGLSGVSNIIAITPGASGAGIQTYSPASVGDAAPNVTISITGFGLDNITTARLYDNGTIITCGSFANQTATTLDITCSTNGEALGTYDLDLEASGTLTAAWVDAFEVTSGGGGDTTNVNDDNLPVVTDKFAAASATNLAVSSFTLDTSAGTDTVTSITVSLIRVQERIRSHRLPYL
jgi:hypothetical protein